MNEPTVTLTGWVGNEVTHRVTSKGNVANFRVAVTPRVKRNGDWVDGTTSWYSVTCWRALADHVAASVRKGDPVVVYGRLRTDVWERNDGQSSTTCVVDALSVGHDLSRGKSTFMKALAAAAPEHDDADLAVREMVHDGAGPLPRFDSEGRELAAEPAAEEEGAERVA